MFGKCRGPLWRKDDFSACFKHDYLETIFPLVILVISVLYLLFQVFSVLYKTKNREGYKRLSHAIPNGDYIPPTASRYIDDHDGLGQGSDSDATSSDGDMPQLTRTITRDSIIEKNHPSGEFLLVAVEELAVLSQLGVHVAILILNIWGRKGRLAAVVSTTIWAYIAVLASLRLFMSSQRRFSFTKLWYHTAFIYCALWCSSSLIFRSEIIHPRTRTSRDLAIVDFSLTTLLALIALTTRKGNRTVKLEYEADIEPSKEQVASLLSLATFSWCDGLIWRGYKKTLEITDVWNLPPRDKAANLLADYRQVKKTAKLAFHLLRYFRRALIIQALWAAVSGGLIFAPTVLLKVILEYIEDPSATPKNAAWFYVILLPITGAVKAVADGQALWIGRKICIRLRAIIIGEIYAKALKRKTAASADKALGGVTDKDDEDSSKPGFFKRIFGKGKKDAKADNTNEEDTPKLENESDEGQVTTGTIINLMAVDSYKVSEICAYLHFLWAATPVQFIGTIALLYSILGFSSFVGIIMMALLLPVNMWLSNQFARLQKNILAATDQRIHITNEVLSNIRIIKFFAWEQRFMAMVDKKRDLELKRLMRRYIIWSLAATIWSGSPLLITLLTFLIYTRVEQKPLYPSVAFTALSLFQILRIPLDQIADMVAHVQESRVSVDRVEEYLSEPETDKASQLKEQKIDDHGDPVIGFERGTFSWGTKGDIETDAFKLINLNVHFHVDRLNVIVGPTGSGKSSMLLALLGEMTLLEGDVYLPGIQSREDLNPDPETGLIESVAYCAQQAWLINASIKENIVFASPWNPERYKDVVIACSLQRDLEILDAGDETLVGEKGVTLSGGQKQRISLARALYSRARHILLDDVLSAVDAHTAKWIFDNAILGPLMRNRTCILVTHNVTLCIPEADHAVVLENGRVIAQGSAAEVSKSGKLAEDTTKSLNVSRGPSRAHSRAPSVIDQSTGPAANSAPDAVINTGKPVQEDQEEAKAVGSVKLSIMILYLAAMGSWFYWTIAGFVFVAQQLISVATNVWIREWANAYSEKDLSTHSYQSNSSITHVTGVSGCFLGGVCGWTVPFTRKPSHIKSLDEPTGVDDWYYAGVYGAIGIVLVISVFLREWVLFYGSIAASRRIHTRLMESVMRAKFRFFDATPLGQIVNRFSKDIEAIDQEVTPVAIGLLYCLLSIATIVVLISIITPGFLVAGAFISILYFATGLLYINSSRDLKRLESVKRSPLYQQFGETLTGMTTIRAYCDERRFIRENIAKINVQNRPFIFLWAANRWLAFRVDIIGSLVSFFSAAFVVLSVGRIDAGAAGLAMTYAVTYSENMLWFVRLYAANEQNMNSVERIKEYLDVEQEAAPIVEDKRPPGNWPSKGSVEFIDYSTRYRIDFDTVLKKISFKVLPGEKVGVVGRTGAGKSSMALALFRALEAETGKILIDDIDIGDIGLQDLREKIVMVPQDPTLFSGTIRSNLDPFGLFTDEEIFTALRRVQLIGSPGSSSSTSPARPSSPLINIDAPTGTQSNTVTLEDSQRFSESTVVDSPSSTTTARDDSDPPHSPIQENKNVFYNLMSPIAESGSNLSQGQRQLLCLARALLKEPAVLLMDEATASIDHATDSKIQETIRHLKNTTITIAHRLKTIVDYDKVLVLDHGKVVEFGTPWELLDINDGVFKGMCEGSGEGQVLRDMALAARDERVRTE